MSRFKDGLRDFLIGVILSFVVFLITSGVYKFIHHLNYGWLYAGIIFVVLHGLTIMWVVYEVRNER